MPNDLAQQVADLDWFFQNSEAGERDCETAVTNKRGLSRMKDDAACRDRFDYSARQFNAQHRRHGNIGEKNVGVESGGNREGSIGIGSETDNTTVGREECRSKSNGGRDIVHDQDSDGK
jgi:hypothetical protein